MVALTGRSPLAPPTSAGWSPPTRWRASSSPPAGCSGALTAGRIATPRMLRGRRNSQGPKFVEKRRSRTRNGPVNLYTGK